MNETPARFRGASKVACFGVQLSLRRYWRGAPTDDIFDVFCSIITSSNALYIFTKWHPTSIHPSILMIFKYEYCISFQNATQARSVHHHHHRTGYPVETFRVVWIMNQVVCVLTSLWMPVTEHSSFLHFTRGIFER